jgi:hypothetical protein
MSTQNVLQGILSQKIVQDGEGGYAVRTDIVNVDNIIATGYVGAIGGILATTFTTESLQITGQTPTISVDDDGMGQYYTLTINAPLDVRGPLILNGNNISGLNNLTINNELTCNALTSASTNTGNINLTSLNFNQDTANISTRQIGIDVSNNPIYNTLRINAPLFVSGPISTTTGSAVVLGNNLNLNGNSIQTISGASIGFNSSLNLNNNNIGNVGSLNLNALTFTGATPGIFTTNLTTQLNINAPLNLTGTQAGQIIVSSGTTGTATVTGVTSTSVVIVTPTSQPDGRYWVTTSANIITLNLETAQGITFNYFVARY